MVLLSIPFIIKLNEEYQAKIYIIFYTQKYKYSKMQIINLYARIGSHIEEASKAQN